MAGPPMVCTNSLKAGKRGDWAGNDVFDYLMTTTLLYCDECRMALGFSYVSDRAFVLSDLAGNSTRGFTPFVNEDEASYAPWIEDLRGKGNIDHPMLPLVHPFPGQSFSSATYQSRAVHEDGVSEVVITEDADIVNYVIDVQTTKHTKPMKFKRRKMKNEV
jgi:hypothetical protein